MPDAGNGITRCEYCGSSCGCDADCPAPHNILMDDSQKLAVMYRRFETLQAGAREVERERDALRQENDWLTTIVEKAPQWTEYDGSFPTLPGEDERILLFRYQSSGHLFCGAAKPCWWVDAMKDFIPLRAGDRWMPWPEAQGGE